MAGVAGVVEVEKKTFYFDSGSFCVSLAASTRKTKGETCVKTR